MKELGMIVWHDLVPKRRNDKKRCYVSFLFYLFLCSFSLILFKKANSKII